MKTIQQNWRVLTGCATMLAATALLASCGNKGGGTDTTTTNGSSNPSATKMTVGFSQIGAESDWRTAETKSIKDEAAKRGVDLKFSDAQGKQENQIKAIRSFIAQGVDVIALAPVVSTGWESVLREAKTAKIPVILTDRNVDVTDPSLYTTFIGSDFVEEGRRAGRFMAKDMGGKATIAELQGTPGAAPAIDRQKGFLEIVKQNPGMKIVKSQSGDFSRSKGKEVMESFLKSPEGKSITAVYSHNDDMAMGAIQAIEESGRKPGTDIKIVSVDGIRDALQALVAGKNNCVVECNPLLGPDLFDTATAIKAGKTVPKHIAPKETVFDQTNAKAALPTRKY